MASTKQTQNPPKETETEVISLPSFQTVKEYPDISKRQFTLFPKLPAELRLKIWGITMSVPRVVLLKQFPGFYSKRFIREDGEEPSDALRGILQCHADPPKLFFVCKESSAEASKVYKNCTDNTVSNVITYQAGVDVLLMEDPHTFHLFDEGRLEVLESEPRMSAPMTSVAILNVDFNSETPLSRHASSLEWSVDKLGERISKYRDLERITFITKSPDTPAFEVIVPPPREFIFRNHEDLDDPTKMFAAREKLFALRMSMNYTKNIYDPGVFLSNISIALQAS